jgi:hypothetical protein
LSAATPEEGGPGPQMIAEGHCRPVPKATPKMPCDPGRPLLLLATGTGSPRSDSTSQQTSQHSLQVGIWHWRCRGSGVSRFHVLGRRPTAPRRVAFSTQVFTGVRSLQARPRTCLSARWTVFGGPGRRVPEGKRKASGAVIHSQSTSSEMAADQACGKPFAAASSPRRSARRPPSPTGHRAFPCFAQAIAAPRRRA